MCYRTIYTLLPCKYWQNKIELKLNLNTPNLTGEKHAILILVDQVHNDLN